MKRSGPVMAMTAGFSLLAPYAAAQTPQVCARIDSDLERLICYDRLFRDGNQAKSTGKRNRGEPPEPVQDNVTAGTKSKMDRSPASGGKGDRGGGRFVPVISTKSSKGDASPVSGGSSKWSGAGLEGGGYLLRVRSQKQHRNIIGQQTWMELIIACRANTTSLSVRFGGNIVASVVDSFQVTLKIDDQPATGLSFGVSEDFKSVGLWSGGQSIPVIKSLFSGAKVQITDAPFFSRSVTATFPVAGLQSAVEPLRRMCSW